MLCTLLFAFFLPWLRSLRDLSDAARAQHTYLLLAGHRRGGGGSLTILRLGQVCNLAVSGPKITFYCNYERLRGQAAHICDLDFPWQVGML